jgi:riboflavin synthase
MFTGLVQQIGTWERIEFEGEAGRLHLSARFDAPLQRGESIAVNGACLTLVAQQGDQLAFDVLKETFDKTSLCDKTPGQPLNLERALRMGDPLGGHLVSGHVDGTGILRRVEPTGRDWILEIEAPPLIHELVAKGSIAIDGVSLTLVDVDAGSGRFTVHVIPHTWSHTALSSLATGARVNLETDMIGKYVRAAWKAPGQAPSVTWSALKNAGFLE